MPPPFQLLASHPALDFINTLDNRFAPTGPTELLVKYADLVRFAEQSQLVVGKDGEQLRKKSTARSARQVLQRALELRECMAEIFYRIARKEAPSQGDLAALSQCYTEAEHQRKLVWTPAGRAPVGAARAAWQWVQGADNPALPVWILTTTAVELLTSASLARVHGCESETCRWLFLDTSKNHSRRWCDMKLCGNRSKARRFQARQR